MSSHFIHLRVYSDYSLGESVLRVSDIIGHCAKHNIPAVALTDKYHMFGALEFSMNSVKQGVQPIVGTIIKTKISNIITELLLIARNNIGIENIFKLSTLSYLGSDDVTVTLKDLYEHKEGLILLYGNAHQESLKAHISKNAVNNICTEFKNEFGENFYLELCRSISPKGSVFEESLLSAALKCDIPIVATNAASFLTQDMHKALDAMLCIANGRYILEDDRKKANLQTYFKSMSEMREIFQDLPEALENTTIIAKKCTDYCRNRKPLLPSFPSESGNNEDEELAKKSIQGLEKRLVNVECKKKKQEYLERLQYELSVIQNMKYSGYFLIVSDFIMWSKKQGIPVGPGRGSGAGSVVAWVMQITDIDPLKFGLLFERFLNPERISMPDFDIDFCQHRRDEVIEYVRKKYGHDKVVQIITFGKLQARAVLRDVGRVLQMPYNVVDKICKMVPNNPANPVNLSQAITLDKNLQESRDNDTDIAELLSISLKLEGMHRHVSTHAAGVVIADRKIEKLIPLYKDKNSEMPVIQYSMKYAEEAGLIKFDFLGLKTLTLISKATSLVQQNIGENFDIYTICLDDAKTYKMLSKGETVGVFQFDGSGMKEIIKKFAPDTIEDLIALTSLYRPGPMDSIPSYISRKKGKEKPQYIHPKLSDILQETHGIIVYQEQVMEIARLLAGYTAGGADILRRAMGKKIKSEMDKQRVIFVNGCINNDIQEKQANEIFDLVAKFASYGFNKSHAAAYSIIAYQTAYLKANYPLEFFTAAINLEIDDSDKVNAYIQDLKRLNIILLPPDINRSAAYFTIEENNLRFGLLGVKGAGLQAIEDIIEERNKYGDYHDIFNMVERCSNSALNKKMLENLAKAGVFKQLHDAKIYHPRVICENAEQLLLYGNHSAQEKKAKQINLFGAIDEHVKPVLNIAEQWYPNNALSKEFEALGFYLSSHPLESYAARMAKARIIPSIQVESYANAKGAKLFMAGVILARKIRSSRRGKYAFVQLSDTYGIFEASIFDEKLLIESENLISVGQKVHLQVNAKEDQNGLRIVIEKLHSIDDMLSSTDVKVSIKLQRVDDNIIKTLKNAFCDEGKILESLSLKLPCGSEVRLRTENHSYKLSDQSIEMLKMEEGIIVTEY